MASSSDPAARLGSTIAEKYRLDEVLGRGGMGAVYRATHTKVGKRFAVKILHPEIAEHREAARRFLHEAQASTRIGHPGILDVYDAGEAEGGVLYMVTELLEGESLAERLTRGPLPVDEAVAIIEQVLEPLEAAHRAGVVHRDVKPHNVFLLSASPTSQQRPSDAETRRVKLLDFGIAKFAATDTSALTRTGTLIGSPLYMAPEQAKAEPDVDARADVWSVGATLFEMLVGSPAHAAPTPVAVVARILMSPAPAPSSLRADVDPGLDAIVKRALCIDREERYASAKEMRAALVQYRAGTADTAASVPSQAISSSSRRSRSSSGDAKKDGVSPSAAAVPSDAAVTAATSVSTKAKVAVAALALGAGAAIAAAWMHRMAPRGEPSTASRTEISSAPPSPPPSESVAPVVAQAAPSTSVAEAPSAPATSTEPSAAAAPSHAPSAAVRAKGPSCAAGEHASQGHCCPRGLEWQVDRCDRPLATTLPF